MLKSTYGNSYHAISMNTNTSLLLLILSQVSL